jgi:DNA-binding CsgD family transcriptional regulator
MHRLDKLTERQKECLRLKYRNLSAKEIGRALGISHDTVNDHFGKARTLFGINDTMAIARMLADAEGYQRIGAHPIGVGNPPTFSDAEPADAIGAARNRYNLTILQRVGIIVAISFASVAFAGALIVGADAINRIFVGYGIDISDPPYRK